MALGTRSSLLFIATDGQTIRGARGVFLRFFPSIPPGVQGNKLAGNRHTRSDEILDRPDDIGNTHVFRRVVVSIYGQDTRLFRVTSMQCFKIPWILRE